MTVVSRNTRAARRLAAKINCPRAGSDLSLLGDCNFIILAVPDSQIVRVAQQIVDRSFHSSEAILVHTSGALNAKVMSAAKNRNRPSLSLAAMHPMQTFPAGIKWDHQALDDYFNHIYFGIDGENRALPVVRKIANTIGAGAFTIPDTMKGLYHAGGVVASNFMIALMYMAYKIYGHAGLNERQSRNLLHPIMAQTLNNIFRHGALPSLTGPAARNDRAIIKKHIQDLKVLGTDFQNAYKDLTAICYMIAKNRNHK
jgi:predicted short-subunit dehydrogenase-like oxidoreductase (DUF2520 family)